MTAATHDLLYYGPFPSPVTIDTSFDHVQFSGVVPRTFTAPVILSLAATPFVALVGWCSQLISGGAAGVVSNKLWSLSLVRAFIGLAYVASWSLFRRTLAAVYTTRNRESELAASAAAAAATEQVNDPTDPHDWSS